MSRRIRLSLISLILSSLVLGSAQAAETRGSPIHLVCVDLAGHGYSSHRHEPVYHFVDYVVDLFDVVDGLGWSNFSIVGHSLGAGVAMVMAG